MAEGFGYSIDISGLDKELVKVEKKLKRLEETSLRVAINMDDAFRQVANGGVKALGDSLSVINKSLREIGSKGGNSFANFSKGATSAANNINSIATAIENINRAKPSNDGVFASISKINMDIIEARSRFKELQKEFTHLSSPAGDKSAHTAIQQEVQFIMEYISVLKKQKQEIIDTQKEIQKAKQRTTQEDPFSKKIAGYNGETLEVKRYKDAMKAMKEFYAEQEKEAQKASQDLSRRLKRENQTYGGALQYSASAKTINEQIIAIRNLEAARDNLSKTDSNYKSKLKTLNDEIAKNKREIEEARGGVERLRESHSRLSNTARQLKNAFTLLFSVSQITGYIRKLVEVRGEFELQERTLQVLLQSQDKATQLWNQVVELAVKSPFRVKELVTYTKQLAAYRVESDKLFDTTKRLADISAGLGVDMQRLILAFGQVKAANFLRGTELRQFTEAGIPMLEELAKYFTQLEGRAVSVGQVFERVSKRMVSFADVEAVLKKMTDAGGVFYNMQEQQAETLKGQMSNLRDSIDIMLNEIGEKQDGVIKGSVAVARTLVENWETLAVVLKGVIGALALYKLNVLLASKKTIEWASSMGIATAEGAKTLTVTQLLNASMNRLKTSIRSVGKSMKDLFLKNWKLAIILATVGAIWKLVKAHKQQKEEIDDIVKSFEQLKKSTRDISVGFTYASNKGDLTTAKVELQKLIDLANREYDMNIKVNLEELTQDELNDYFVELRAQIEEAQAFAQNVVVEIQKLTEWTMTADVVESGQILGQKAAQRMNFLTEARKKAIDALNEEKRITGELTEVQQQAYDLMYEPRRIDESELDYLTRLNSGYTKLKDSIEKVNYESLQKGGKEARELKKKYENLSNRFLTKESEWGLTEDSVLAFWKGDFARQFQELFKNIYISDALTDEQKTLQLKLAIDKAQTQFGWNQFVRDYVEDMVEKQFGVKFAKKAKKEESLEAWAQRVKDAVDGINKKIKAVNPQIEDMDLFPMPKAGQTKEAYLALAKDVLQIAKKTYLEGQKIEDQSLIDQTNALKPYAKEFEEVLNIAKKEDKSESNKIINKRISLIKEMYQEYLKLYDIHGASAKEMVEKNYALPFKEAFEGLDITFSGLLIDKDKLREAKEAGAETGKVFSQAMLDEMDTMAEKGVYIRGLSEDDFKAVKEKLKLDEDFVGYIYDDSDTKEVKTQIKTLEELYKYFDKVTGEAKKVEGQGTLTIGYGHALQTLDEAKAYLGIIMDQHEAEQLLEKDIRDRERPLNSLLDRYKELIITQGQYNTLFNNYYQGGLGKALNLAKGDISKVKEYVEQLNTDLEGFGSSFAKEWGENWLEEYSKLETFAERFAKLLEISSVTTVASGSHIEWEKFQGMKNRSLGRAAEFRGDLEIIRLLEKAAINISEIDFTNIQGVVDALLRLRPIAKKEGKESVIALEREISQFSAEIGITTKKDADQKIKDEVQSLFDQYEVSLTLKKLNIPKDLAKDVFNVDMITLDELKEKVVSTFAGTDEYAEAMENLSAKMQLMFNGNVDLLNRKLIPAQELAKKGWKDVGEGIATVFSSTYDIENASGEMVKVLVTPILPDGSVLSQEELDAYVNDILQGTEDMLKADEKGIVISVGLNAEQGEDLHKMQEDYYKFVGMTSEKQKQLIDELNKGLSEINWTIVGDIVGKTQMEVIKKQLEELGELQDKQTEENVKRFVKFLTKTLDATKVIQEQKGVDIAFAKKMFDDGAISAQQFAEVVKNITQQANEDISKVNLDKFKESPEYIQAMGDMSAYTTDELKKLLNSLRKVVAENSHLFDADEAKAYQEAIARAQEELDVKEKSLFRWEELDTILKIRDVEKEITTQKKEKERLAGEEKRLLDEQKAREEELKKLEEERQDILSQIAQIESTGGNAKALKEKLDSKVTQIEGVKGAIVDGAEAVQGVQNQAKTTEATIGQLGGKLKGLANGATSTVAIIDAIVHGINETVQGISDITAEIGSVMESFGKDTDMSTNFGKFQKGWDIFAKSSQAATDAWDALKNGDPVGVVVNVVKSVTEIIKGVNEYKDAVTETQIQDHLEEVERLEREYEKLGWVIERALSIKKYGMVAEQTKNIGQQVDNLYKAISLEEDKKNTDKERIKELRKQAEDAQHEIQELYDNLRQEIVGSYEDLSSTLADAMIEALKSGEDALTAWGNAVDEIIEDIVKKLSIQKYVEPHVSRILDEFYSEILPKNAAAEKAFKKWQSLNESDAGYEQAYKKYLKLNEQAIGELPTISEDAINRFKEDLEKVGVGFEAIAEMVANLYDGTTSEGLTSLQKGIQGLTEDQGEVLASYWNAVRGYTASIDAKMDAIIANMTISAEDNPMLEQLKIMAKQTSSIYDLLTIVTASDDGRGGKGIKVYFGNKAL